LFGIDLLSNVFVVIGDQFIFGIKGSVLAFMVVRILLVIFSDISMVLFFGVFLGLFEESLSVLGREQLVVDGFEVLFLGVIILFSLDHSDVFFFELGSFLFLNRNGEFKFFSESGFVNLLVHGNSVRKHFGEPFFFDFGLD